MKIIKPLSFLLLLFICSSIKGNAQSTPPMYSIKPKLADSATSLSKIESLKVVTGSISNSFVKKMGLNNSLAQPVAMPNAYTKSNSSAIPIPTVKIGTEGH